MLNLNRSWVEPETWYQESQGSNIEQLRDGLQMSFNNQPNYYQLSTVIDKLSTKRSYNIKFKFKCLGRGFFRIGILEADRSKFISLHECYGEKHDIIVRDISFRPKQRKQILVITNSTNDMISSVIMQEFEMKKNKFSAMIQHKKDDLVKKITISTNDTFFFWNYFKLRFFMIAKLGRKN